MTSIERWVKWLWVAGIVIWATAEARGFWEQYHAQNYAQASSASYRLIIIALSGAFWSFGVAFLRAKLKEGRMTKA
jgi:hypothetical protein